VLEKYEDVVGRTRDQRRVCGARGGATIHLYGMQAFALAVFVNYTASRRCVMAESEADYGFRCCVFVDTSYTPGPSKLALLPIRAGFRVYWSAWQKRRTANPPQI
jgi:hypothetical protein